MPNTKNKGAAKRVATQAERLKAIRKHLGLSQEDFARESKVSTSLLSKMETGAVAPSTDFATTLYTRWLVNPDFWTGAEGHEDVMFTGTPKVNQIQQAQVDSPWRDVALTEVAGERDNLRAEVSRLWGIINKFMTGELQANFPLSVEGAA